MVPNLEDGDYVIAKRLGPADVITIGDIVEIDHPSLGPIIKMIKSARFGNVQFQGLSVRSTEPDQIGWHLEFGPGSGRVGHHARMLDQGLDRTERFGE